MLQQVVVMLVGIILPRFMLKYYGSNINGLITSITQVISYFILIEAGISSSVVYNLYKPLAERNWDKVSGIVSATKSTYKRLGYIFLGLSIPFAFLYPFISTIKELSKLEVVILVMIIGVSGAMEFFTLAKYRVIITASQNSYIISLATAISTIVNAAIIISLSIFRINIVLIKFIAISAILIRCVILDTYAKITFKQVNYDAPPDYSALNKRWDACFMQILFSVQSGAPIIIATIFLTYEQVSVYSIFNMIFAGLMGVFNIFVNGAFTSIGDLMARKMKDRLRKVYAELQTAYYSVVAIVYAITVVTINDFVRLYVSGVVNAMAYDRPTVGIIFTLVGLAQMMQTPQGLMTTAAGMFKEVKKQSIIHALIIVIGGSIAGAMWGLEGILVVALLANIYRFIYYAFFVSEYIIKNTSIYPFFQLMKVLVVFFINVAINYAIKFTPATFNEWIAKAVAFGIFDLIIVIFIVFFFERDNSKNIARRLLLIKKPTNS